MAATRQPLAEALAGLTTWDGETPGLWRHALDSADEHATAARSQTHDWRRSMLGLAAVIVVAVVLVGIMLPSLGKARSAARFVASSTGDLSEKMVDRSDVGDDATFGQEGVYRYAPEFDRYRGSELGGGGGGQSPFQDKSVLGRQVERFDAARININTAGGGLMMVSSPDDQTTSSRHVVRKAAIQLQTDDVNAAYTLARQLINSARGEYIDGAVIRDNDQGQPAAELTLRVEAARLDDVLNELRKLGKVIQEGTDADDVTDRVVDLEAQIRNEKGVEEELLNLLKDRQNDKLDDILAVRRELAKVREQIERLTAQRTQYANLVSLATITVIIRPDEVKPDEPEPEPTFWTRVGGDFKDATLNGVDALFATAATLLMILIGGLPWWILAAACTALIWRHWRSAHPRPLPE
ncbi:MAG: DUF4349 domain-containing protein [Phycisphaeraceae bacterium]|nr:MAG: DUF4349 domain-containing protein [Phycisphaeraceae bacterium]